MRVYVAADAAGLRLLADGGALPGEPVTAQSEDEDDELDALLEAAESGAAVVVAAEVSQAADPVALAQVAAFHVDVDGSGDLAWFATQELPDVLALLEQQHQDDRRV